jgi:ferredoxin
VAERGARLRVDPVACDGVGICAHLAADLIGTDSWGYPVVSGDRLDAERLRQARAAVRACPRRALFLDQPQAAAKAAGR